MIRLNMSSLMKTVILLGFMLFAVDIFGMGWYILAATFLLTAFYALVMRKRLKITNLFMWVFLLAISNFLIMFVNSSASAVVKIMKYLLSPLMSYAIGSFLASETEEGNDIFKLYMYAVIPFFIHGVLNQIGFRPEASWDREVPDFWTGELWKATLHCAYFAMAVPLVFLAFAQKGFLKRAVFLGLTAFSVYASITTSSRTIIYIGIVAIALETFLYLRLPGKTGEKRKGAFLFSMAAAVAVVVVLVFRNMDALSETFFFRRMFETDVTEEPRIKLFMNIILNTWYYPFGKMPYFYSHNTWLDFLRQSGWITFICFFAVTVIALKDLVAVFKNQCISQSGRVAVVGMMAALLMVMFVEPIMDGSAILFSLFFYFIAVNRRFARKLGEKHV